jgi:N-methylhydantoinase A
MNWRLGIDIGGTFTDFALVGSDGRRAIHKQLTTPSDPSEAVLSGTATLLKAEDVQIEAVETIVHGTTLVTNAVIERRGAVTGMLTTAGFRDIADMRHEKRYDVFDLRLTFPEPVVPRSRRREVRERVLFDGRVETPLDLAEARGGIAELVEAHDIEALAICLLHSYANPSHEQAVAEMVRAEFPGLYVSASAEVLPERREFERFTTACVNAFTQPLFDRYLQHLEDGLIALGFSGRLYVMSSSGGSLTPQTARRFPVRVIESGPAAGAAMSAVHGRALGLSEMLSFDMGGTTAKGALIRNGAPLKVYELEVGREHDFKRGSGLPVKSPVTDMIEIGSGGGSIAAVDARGTIRVGPRSAGADPGPACYGRGGTAPTLTDANLVLGYLDPGFFLGGGMALDRAAADDAILREIARPLNLSLERAAWGIHEIVNEDIARAFRIHASERGFDYRAGSMVAFGGSGPVHALGVAAKLKIPRVIFPVAAGVMSAVGLLTSPLAFEVSRSREVFVEQMSAEAFAEGFRALEEEAMAPLLDAGLAAEEIAIERAVDARYHGQGHMIELLLPATANPATLKAQLPALFRRRYEALYAISNIDAPLVVTTWKVEARGPAPALPAASGPAGTGADASIAIKGERRAWLGEEGYLATPVYDRQALTPGMSIAGPALIEERESTCVITAAQRVTVDARLNLVAELEIER